MRAEVISIGDELTSGQRLDTNSQWLSERLGELGVTVVFHTTVADDLAANVLVFRQACERADLVVASGGLGPTADDLTREALAQMAGVELVQNDEALAHIRSLFARRMREMPPANVVQAQFPSGSRPIPNPHGTAPGIDFSWSCPGMRPARIFALPGVPAEMKEMWGGTVRGEIEAMQERAGARTVIVHHRIKCFGVGESDLEAMLPDLSRRGRTPSVGITVSQATITLRITAKGETEAAARSSMQPTMVTIHQCLGDLVYGEEDDELADAVIRLLREQNRTLALCECGTGGLTASWLSECDPQGDFFRFARVLREQAILGSDALAAMTSQTRELVNADLALGIGPFPEADSAGKSGGDIDLAIASLAGVVTRSTPFSGHPEILRSRAAKQALNFLRLHLLRG